MHIKCAIVERGFYTWSGETRVSSSMGFILQVNAGTARVALVLIAGSGVS